MDELRDRSLAPELVCPDVIDSPWTLPNMVNRALALSIRSIAFPPMIPIDKARVELNMSVSSRNGRGCDGSDFQGVARSKEHEVRVHNFAGLDGGGSRARQEMS
jgi:hypothetical protein